MAEKKPYSGTKTVWVASDYGNLTRAGELKNLADLQSSIPAQSELPGISTINTPNLTGGVTIKPTPALNQTARQILADPKAFVERSPATPGNVGFLDRGKDLLGRIFDYEDKADLSVGPVNLSGVESVWDGFLRSFDWFYDRINQLGTAAISALPGGTRTLTYKEAGEVSFGQQFVANAGVSAGRIRRGEGNLGDLTAVASLPGLAAFLAPDSAIQQPGFDITSEEDRKAFDSGYEKFFSGLTDTFYTVFADPLIVGGKAAKVTKLRYLTKPLNSPARQKEFVDNLDRGIEAYTQNNVPLEQVSPEAQFLIWSVGGDGVGRARTAQEMLKRAEIQDLGMEGVTTALALMPRTRFANGVFEAVPQAELLQQGRDLLAAPFDAAAKARVQQAIPASLLAIANAERMKIALQLQSDPNLKAGILYEKTKMRDDAFNVYQSLVNDNRQLLDDFADPSVKAGSMRGQTLPSQIEDARLLYEDLDVTVKALENGTLPDVVAFRGSYDDVEKAIDQLMDQNASLRAAIEGASRVTVTDSYGFAADNRFGRFVTQRRAKRAQANYEYQATYAAKEVDSVDFFGNSRFVNTIRVWRWPSILRPSGYVVTDGANDVDGITEVESLLNSLRALAGRPKEVQVQAKKYNERTRAYDPVFDADGKPVMQTLMVGGVPAKERLMAEFMRNYSLNQNMAAAVYTFERSLRDELGRFYDVNEETLKEVVAKAMKNREETAANLVDKKRRYFAEPEKNSDLYVLNIAPHLKSQLANGMYVLPYDVLEKVLRHLEKQARKGSPNVSSAIFNWQTNITETGGAYLNNFYDFWRPAVLFRLGYPQRNVGEGDFRSMAFFASVAPLAWTAKGMAYGATNFGRAKRVERQLEKLKEQIGRPDVTRDKFDELMVKQDALRREQMRLVRKAQEYQSPNFELPDSFSLENSLGEAVTEFGLPAFKTADNTIVIYKDETGAWGVREKRIVDGEELLVDVEGLPLTFRSEITAQRAFETLMNDMIRSIKDTGQPNEQARAFMAIEGSYIGEFLRKGVEVTPKPIEIDAGVIGAAANPSKAVNAHPRLNQYRDGGMGGVGDDRSVVGFVDPKELQGMAFNVTDEAGVATYVQALRNGEGFTDPIILLVDPRRGRMVIGEGNHRLAAALQVGADAVPVRVSRTNLDDAAVRTLEGKASPTGKTPTAKTRKINSGIGASWYETLDGRFQIRQNVPPARPGWAVFDMSEALPGGEGNWWQTYPTKRDAVKSIEEEVEDVLQRQAAEQTTDVGVRELDVPPSPFGTQADPGYWPSDIHPSFFGFKNPFDAQTKELKSLSEVEDAIRQLDNQINDLDTQMDQFGGRPISAALKNTKFQKWRANQMAALEQQIDEAEQWIKNAREDSRSIDLDATQQATLVFLNDQIRTLRNQQRVLERDDVYALSEYGRQAAAKRRVDHGGSVAFTPGVTLHSAFGDPRYADIAWSNMSSDNTIKATLSLRLQFYDSLFYKKNFETYREVTPEMGDRYWEGMADYLQQYHYDPVGQKILEGQSVRDIAVWMLGSNDGRALRDSLDSINRVLNSSPEAEAVLPLIGNSMENAEAWVSRIANALYRVTLNNAAITEALKRGPVDAAFLKQQIGDSPGLFPVIGHVDEISGRKTLMEFWRTMTSKTFHAIGTLPEDSLVRGPFYAKRYDQARKQLMEMLAAKYGNDLNKVPLDEALDLTMRAHRTALRDTKKYLYTIDRRTNLATYGEHVFPFITATQNSVTTLGRLMYRDPSIPGILLALWSAPTRVGWEDEQGNIRIPLPEQLIPDGVERFFGIEGFKNILVNKDSLNVIFPESGFGFVPRPTPLVQVAASELMKNGFFGMFSVEAPDLLVKFAGKKDADTIWKYWKNYIFGEESAISPEFLSYDKITPPTLNRIIQLIQGDTSNQYAYQYGLQARTMDLMWRAGQLENYPTAEEVAARTNGMFFLRWLGNAFAFTPPTYESPVDQLIQMQRQYDQVYGILGPQKFSENFGNETLILANTETAQNVGGTTVTVDTVRNINRYEGLLGELAPTLGTDLGVLGILVNPDPGESEYDTNAYRWMTTTNIPGTSRKWRELNTGQEAVQEAQRQAGWVEYIKFKNSLDALLQQRGLSSYRVKAAADLNLMRKQFEENMLNNPLYDGWKQDFMTPGSTKTMSALKVIGRALQDETFMADHQDDKTWWMATQYMAARQQVVDYIKASGKSASDPVNEQVLLEWDAFRQDLMNQDIGWASLSNRYLLSDDVPEDFGTSFLEG